MDTTARTSPDPPSARLSALDWLRVLAVLGVFLFHAVHPFDLTAWHIKNAEQSALVTFFIAFALYGVMTFLSQIEVAWFAPVMTTMAITPALSRGLLLQTVPIALIFVPLAVLALGRGRQPDPLEPGLPLAHTPAGWAVRLALIAAAYLGLYFGFGALVAWQNPAVRALDDQGRDPLVFDSWRLVPFQILRSQLWVLFALPVVAMLRGSRWQVAVVVGLLFALPMNIVHVIPNPIMEPSVRLSHFVETASSNFLFGLLVATLLLYQPRPASRPLAAPSV